MYSHEVGGNKNVGNKEEYYSDGALQYVRFFAWSGVKDNHFDLRRRHRRFRGTEILTSLKAFGSFLLQKNSLYYSDQRFMQHKSGEIFWTHTHGRTLTPEDPFKLMVWHFERIEQHPLVNKQKLTKRESEITQLIVNGLTCKEIARKLSLSHRTVEAHKANLMKKLDVHSKHELSSKIIIQNNLIHHK